MNIFKKIGTVFRATGRAFRSALRKNLPGRRKQSAPASNLPVIPKFKKKDSFNQRIMDIANTFGTDSSVYQQYANRAYSYDQRFRYSKDGVVQINEGIDIEYADLPTVEEELDRLESLALSEGLPTDKASLIAMSGVESRFIDYINGAKNIFSSSSGDDYILDSIAHHKGRKLSYSEMQQFVERCEELDEARSHLADTAPTSSANITDNMGDLLSRWFS